MKTWRYGMIGLSILLLCGLVHGDEKLSVLRINPEVPYNLRGDDIACLRKLAAGIGWEFEPNAKTTEGLKQIGIRWMRCINVSPLNGKFGEKGQFFPEGNKRLDQHLKTCRAIGASPHIIIALRIHPELRVTAKDIKTTDKRILGGLRNRQFGPNDWGKHRNTVKAYFKYVLIDRGFSDAVFEVGNEPDIGGTPVRTPPFPAMGSRRLYEAYFDLYKNVATAACEFEAENPGVKVRLGGPAAAFAFTFRFGDFNWSERFLQDIQREKVKLDFIGVHYYGNISPLSGESKMVYPSFADMMRSLRRWRDQYTPGVPIWFTEWGTSYHVNFKPISLHNASHVGASFTAAFLNQMLVEDVDRALYLVTTDLRKKIDGKWKNNWGFPSLFTNHYVLGTHPKAPYHVFQMIRRLAPNRIEATNPGGDVGCIASRDNQKRITLLIWNNSYRISGSGIGLETGEDEIITLKVPNGFFKGPVRIRRWMVSRTVSNALYLFEKGEDIDKRADLQQVDEGVFRPIGETFGMGFVLPPSSVSLVELVEIESPLKRPTTNNTKK